MGDTRERPRALYIHPPCSFNPNPTERHTVFGMTIGAYFTWMSVYGVSQAMVQRYLTIPTIQGARK